MAEPPRTPTKAETRVCRTCNENIVVKNHPWDLFGAKASQENIPSVLERFFELKVALNDGLPSYICRCCHHKEVKFQEFFRKNTFSRQQQESVLRVKRGKTTAESPSGRSPQTRRDLKKSRTYEEAPANKPHAQQMHMDKPSKTRHGQYFLHLHQNATGKNESLQRELNPQQSPQRYQNKKKSSRSLACWTHWYFIFANIITYKVRLVLGCEERRKRGEEKLHPDLCTRLQIIYPNF